MKKHAKQNTPPPNLHAFDDLHFTDRNSEPMIPRIEMGKDGVKIPEQMRKKNSKISGSAVLGIGTEKPKKPCNKSKAPSYTDGMDLPSSSDEEEVEDDTLRERSSRRAERPVVERVVSQKELRKREKKDLVASVAADLAKQEALKEDRDAFNVTGGRTSLVDVEDDTKANVKDITVENFSVSARGNKLLDEASLKISHGRRYGLVGPNGSGKSTLLKLLAWRKIHVPRNIDLLLVEQEVVGDDRSALETVVSANEDLVETRRQIAYLESNAESEGGELSELYERMRLMGWNAAESQASKILAGLGFSKEMQARATKSFSGGWRMRISLARALFIQPTLLLLDEPTNHLDLRAVLWLEEYLCRWKKTLVVVSHDRDFLNAVCNEIIHISEGKKLFLCHGDYDSFEKANGQLQKAKEKKDELIEKKNASEKKKGNPPAKGKKKANKKKVCFSFPQPTELTPPLLQLIDVGFSYPDRSDFKLSNIDGAIDMGTRVAIVGPNGAGKSTILNLIAGDLAATEGRVSWCQKPRIGRYSQHFVDLLTMEETPVQYLLRLHPDQEGLSKAEAVRAQLGKFGLPSPNHVIPIAKLSGGQKARVVFTSISMSRPHILLLDEPTNHLDMESIDALAVALDEFEGGVVLVSHDSRLISSVCKDETKSEIWIVKEGNTTTVDKFKGSFEEYKKKVIEEIMAECDD